MEYSALSVDESSRITLPQHFAKRAGWITGNQAHNGWLLLGSPGRCRLLSAAEVDSNPDFKPLLDRIDAELNAPIANALEFQVATSAVLALRLLPVEIKPRGPGWRLALPAPIGAIMQIRAGESDVAALFLQDHIEFWTIETLKSAVATQLTEII